MASMNTPFHGKTPAEWNDEMIVRYNPGAYHEQSNAVIRAIERKRTREIIRLLHIRGEESVLEVGVGAGNVLEQIPAKRRFGLDLSMRILRDAARRLRQSASLTAGDAAALPIASRTFDRVVCSEVLEHLPDPGAAVAEIARVVRDDGIVVISVPNERLIDRVKTVLQRLRALSFFSSREYRVPLHMKDEWHLHEFDLTLLRKIVEPHFRVETTVGVPTDLFPIRYVARCRPRSPR
jgi:ubiquinone/menaquinone biosynthesis C-methylase UbiE